MIDTYLEGMGRGALTLPWGGGVIGRDEIWMESLVIQSRLNGQHTPLYSSVTTVNRTQA